MDLVCVKATIVIFPDILGFYSVLFHKSIPQ